MTYTFVNVEVESEGLKVTTTDASNEHFPTNTTPSAPDEDGRQFYYKPIRNQKAKHKLYCTKLGAALARELKRTDSNIDIPNNVLTDLPEGYQLFKHVKNYIYKPKKNRTDTYLFGFGSVKFRSPAEFTNHLLWLASDQSTHCKCKYCSKAQSTSVTSSKTTPQKQILEQDNKQEKDLQLSKPEQANDHLITQLEDKQVEKPKYVPKKRTHKSTANSAVPAKRKKTAGEVTIICQINSDKKEGNNLKVFEFDEKDDECEDDECEDVSMPSCKSLSNKQKSAKKTAVTRTDESSNQE